MLVFDFLCAELHKLSKMRMKEFPRQIQKARARGTLEIALAGPASH